MFNLLLLVFQFVGFLIHVLVFHRLKCTKDISKCLKEDRFGLKDLSQDDLKNLACEVVKYLEKL